MSLGSTTNGEESTTALTSGQSPLIQIPNQLISIKLDESNYLIWKQQVLTTVRGYGLEAFITGDSSAPDKTLRNVAEDGTEVVQTLNPAYPTWIRQDQLLASWLLSSLSEGILVLMVGLSTAAEIWKALEVNFSSQTLAKQMQYKLQLQTLRKANLSMREYLNKMKVCFDILATTGNIVSQQDQILHILSGLGSDYNAVMISVTSRPEGFTRGDVEALLLSYESRLDTAQMLAANNDASQASINLTTQGNQSRGSGNNNYSNNKGRSNGAQQNNRGRGGNYRGLMKVVV